MPEGKYIQYHAKLLHHTSEKQSSLGLKQLTAFHIVRAKNQSNHSFSLFSFGQYTVLEKRDHLSIFTLTLHMRWERKALL